MFSIIVKLRAGLGLGPPPHTNWALTHLIFRKVHELKAHKLSLDLCPPYFSEIKPYSSSSQPCFHVRPCQMAGPHMFWRGCNSCMISSHFCFWSWHLPKSFNLRTLLECTCNYIILKEFSFNFAQVYIFNNMLRGWA